MNKKTRGNCSNSRSRKAKSRSYPSSAEIVANNLDLLTDILIRIPASFLFKFTFVSKQWHSLLSDPKFCYSHTLFHLNPNSPPLDLLLHNYLPEFSVPTQILSLKTSEVSLLEAPQTASSSSPSPIDQVCNGLFVLNLGIPVANCTRFSGGLLLRSFETSFFGLYNPTTRQFKKINFPKEIEDSVISVSLAFDPSLSPYYNLISVREGFTESRKRCDHKRCYHIDMYSSETDSWSLLGIDTGIDYPGFASPLYYKGAIHWPFSSNNWPLYFDVETKSLKRMPELPDGSRLDSIGYFGESRGHLHLVFYSHYEQWNFTVFEMATDYSEWRVKYSVDLLSVRFRFPIWQMRGISIFSVICEEKEEDSKIVLYVNGVVYAYDIYHSNLRELCHLKLLTDPTSKCGNGKCHRWFESIWQNAVPLVQTLHRF